MLHTLLMFSSLLGVQFMTDIRLDYDFTTPTSIYHLPKELNEISGISRINDDLIACIEDESGNIYIYSIAQEKIQTVIRFSDDGDYEDIAVVGDNAYVLRSDGEIFEVVRYRETSPKVVSHNLGIPATESESLSFNPWNGKLLVSNKKKIEGTSSKAMTHPIYSIDWQTWTVGETPDIVLNLQGLDEQGSKKYHLKPSAMAVHPLNRQHYMVSAVDNSIITFNDKGTVLGRSGLDSEIFKQPEGITFLSNGDMLIGNEGGKSTATMVRLRYKHVAK